jgi:hypothetical protein
METYFALFFAAFVYVKDRFSRPGPCEPPDAVHETAAPFSLSAAN